MNRVCLRILYTYRRTSLPRGESLKENRCTVGKSFLREAIYGWESFDWCGNVPSSARRADKETHYRHPYCALKLRGGVRSDVLRDINIHGTSGRHKTAVTDLIDLARPIDARTENKAANRRWEIRSIAFNRFKKYVETQRTLVTITSRTGTWGNGPISFSEVKSFYFRAFRIQRTRTYKKLINPSEKLSSVRETTWNNFPATRYVYNSKSYFQYRNGKY